MAERKKSRFPVQHLKIAPEKAGAKFLSTIETVLSGIG
jgi:hypothetical protein